MPLTKKVQKLTLEIVLDPEPTKLTKESNMSNPITITVSNKDAGNQYILIFQKPTNVSEMYDTLFPTAWKVLPLSNSSNANITYPVELQIMVKESATSYDAKNRGTIQETEVGQLWEFFVEKDFPMLKKAVSAKPVDGLMGCVNKAAQKIDVGLAKSGKTLVVKRKVSQDDQANFKLTDKLYFAYVTDIEEGESDQVGYFRVKNV